MKLNALVKVEDDKILEVQPPKTNPVPLEPANLGDTNTEEKPKSAKIASNAVPTITESIEPKPGLNIDDGKNSIPENISLINAPAKPPNARSNESIPKNANPDQIAKLPSNSDATENKSKTSEKKDEPKIPIVTQPIIKDGTSDQEVETNGEDPNDTIPSIDGDQEQKNEENLLNENDLLKSGLNNPDEESAVSQKDDDDDDDYIGETDEGNNNIAKAVPKTKLRPDNDDDVIIKHDPFVQEQDSNFIIYLMFFMFISIIGYVGYHNKGKILALVLEGRRSSTSSGRGGGRRKHTAAYRKLDSNLEEAITSNTNGSRTTQNIIY